MSECPGDGSSWGARTSFPGTLRSYHPCYTLMHYPILLCLHILYYRYLTFKYTFLVCVLFHVSGKGESVRFRREGEVCLDDLTQHREISPPPPHLPTSSQ